MLYNYNMNQEILLVLLSLLFYIFNRFVNLMHILLFHVPVDDMKQNISVKIFANMYITHEINQLPIWITHFDILSPLFFRFFIFLCDHWTCFPIHFKLFRVFKLLCNKIQWSHFVNNKFLFIFIYNKWV